MTAGVPGLGLSGLFVLLSVLFMPMRRVHRPETRPARSLPLLAMAAVIGATIWLSWEFLMPHGPTADNAIGGGDAIGTSSSTLLDTILAAPVILISLGIVVTIILAVEMLSHIIDCRPTPTEPAVHRISPGVTGVSEG